MRHSRIPAAFAIAGLTALAGCGNMMGGGSSQYSQARPVAPAPVAPDTVKEVQAKLKQDGYYRVGDVDGVWGSGTSQAVQAFQRDRNLNQSGQLDVPTIQAMNLPNGADANRPVQPTQPYPNNPPPNNPPPANPPNR